jgi:replicative DNA helicase
MRQGNIHESDWDKMNSASTPLGGIWIDDKGSVTVGHIRSTARAAKKRLLDDWKKKNPRKKVSEFKMIVLIDYLQLLGSTDKSKNGTREQEVSAMARGLKSLAKELKCPVVALAQLSRAVETRGGDKRPILSDLKESGDIEAAADMVIFLYRAEYYDLTEFSDGRSTKDIGELIVAKYRHGRTGTYETRFTGRGGWKYFEDDVQDNPFPDPKRVVGRDITIPRSEMEEKFPF